MNCADPSALTIVWTVTLVALFVAIVSLTVLLIQLREGRK